MLSRLQQPCKFLNRPKLISSAASIAEITRSFLWNHYRLLAQIAQLPVELHLFVGQLCDFPPIAFLLGLGD